MRTGIIILILLICLKGKSQENTDGVFIFKVQLFLEKANVINAKGFDVKSEELMNFFIKNIRLEVDTLQSYGFTGNYVFLNLSIKEGIRFNDTVLKTDSSFFLFVENDCSNYVLAINTTNGKSYRLKGFSGNDFFDLFTDINKHRQWPNENGIGMKFFLRNYKVDSVDFNCLYSALKAGEYNLDKYPCLKSCEIRNTEIQ